MSKSIQILFLFTIVGVILVHNNAMGKSLDNEQSLDSDLRKKIFMEELNEYDRKLE